MWVNLPFITMDDAIFKVMVAWYLEWCTMDLAKLEKVIAQQQKQETKLHITKLVERKFQEHEVAMQWKAGEVAVTAQMAETTTVPTKETKEGQDMSMEQDIQEEAETKEHTTKSTQVKRSRVQEKPIT